MDDLFAFRVKHLHRELGLNVAMPVLPHHGPRRDLGHSWPGFDLLGNIATMIRAVSDVRSVIGWIGDQDPASVAVVGMSLGGPVAALTAGLDERVERGRRDRADAGRARDDRPPHRQDRWSRPQAGGTAPLRPGAGGRNGCRSDGPGAALRSTAAWSSLRSATG